MFDVAGTGFQHEQAGLERGFCKTDRTSRLLQEKFHHIVWADSIRIGLAQPFNNSFVPLSEAFFTGGGNSLRGFPARRRRTATQVYVCRQTAPRVRPKDPCPTGGNELLIVNSEARIPLPASRRGSASFPFTTAGMFSRLSGSTISLRSIQTMLASG